jgi:transmembrane sensor
MRSQIEQAIDEAFVERVWSGVGPRREAQARSRRRWRVGSAVAVMALAAGLGWSRYSPEHPLHLTSGAAVVAIAAPGVALDDGSQIDLTPGAAFDVTRNTSNAFEGSLRSGVGTFDVVPNGPRRWVIDCGLATVEVIGTRFRIEAASDHVNVHVDRGHVRVRSASGATDLVAGEEISVDAARAAHPVVPASAAPVTSPELLPNAPPSVEEEKPVSRPAGAASHATTPPSRRAEWRELARGGDYGAAYASLGDDGVTRETTTASIDDLLALADVARLSGHPAEAVGPLSRVVDRGGADARVAAAAFSLGRVELDSLGHPAKAATAFTRAIELGLPSALVEGAYLRLVEARAKAGDRDGARAAYTQYRRTFHDEGREAAMRRWIGD